MRWMGPEGGPEDDRLAEPQLTVCLYIVTVAASL
jgi:hypothetical protein